MKMGYTEQFVQRGQNRIYTREYGGARDGCYCDS